MGCINGGNIKETKSTDKEYDNLFQASKLFVFDGLVSELKSAGKPCSIPLIVQLFSKSSPFCYGTCLTIII